MWNGKEAVPYHKNMAAPEGFEQRECLRVYLVDVLGFLESGNHDCNSFNYSVIRLHWVKCVGEVLGHRRCRSSWHTHHAARSGSKESCYNWES